MLRRSATVLAADVVGYTRLIEEDEAATLDALHRLRAELFRPAVSGNRGRLVKSMGDGWLVEFPGPEDAVNCALRIQDALAREPRIRLRIGIHSGVVTWQDEDIFGEAVNIAARLENAADPGAILISDTVHRALDNVLRLSFDEIGPRRLRNIAQPVHVWARGASPSAKGAAAIAVSRELPASFPLLSIRPIATSDPRNEVRELAAALTSDLFDYLGQFRWLSAVIAEAPLSEAYALSCTLRASGDRLRLHATLSDRDGGPLWTHRIDGDIRDGFDWQDAAGADIASGVLGVLKAEELRLIAGLDVHAMDAERLLLKSMLVNSVHIDDVVDSLELIEAAVAKAPGLGLAYAFGVGVLASILMIGYGERLARFEAMMAHWIERADALLDPDSPSRINVAYAKYRLDGDGEALRRTMNTVLRRAPFHQYALTFAFVSAMGLGEPELAIDYARRAAMFISDTVHVATPEAIIAICSVMLGRDEEALEHARRSAAIRPRYLTAHLAMAAAQAHLGRMEEARQSIAVALEIAPGHTVRNARESRQYSDNPRTRRFFEGLRLAGLPE